MALNTSITLRKSNSDSGFHNSSQLKSASIALRSREIEKKLPLESKSKQSKIASKPNPKNLLNTPINNQISATKQKSPEKKCCEIAEVRELIKTQNENNKSLIADMRVEIESKLNKEMGHLRDNIESEFNKKMVHLREEFIEEANKIYSNINEIKNISTQTQKVSNSTQIIQKQMDCASVNNFNFIDLGSAMINTRNELESEMRQIRNRIEFITESNKHVEEILCSLLDNNPSDKKKNLGDNKNRKCKQTINEDEMGDFDNALQCMQAEIDGVKTSLISDEEKNIIMNRELHVLSAKYIHFNGKMNNFLRDYNRQKLTKSKNIIDQDAKPFITQIKKKSKQAKQTNLFASHATADRRLFCKYDSYAYTRHITVHIENAEVYDLNTFVNEFKTKYEKHFGRGIVNKVTVTWWWC